MQVTAEASFSRTEVTLCVRSAGVWVVVNCSCSVPVSGSLHVPLLHLLIDSSALQGTPRPLHVRDCLELCTAITMYTFLIHCLSSVELLHLCDKSRGKRTRQDGIKETRTWYKHARYFFFLICRQSTMPHCLSAIRNPQLGRPRVLPLVLRAQVMRVCFIVFAARLVVIFWHFRQVVVVISVVI